MKSNRNNRNSNSNSPSNRSRSRERERDRERDRDNNREKDKNYNRGNEREKHRERNNNNRENNKHQQHSSHESGNIIDGKLYLSNIPINITEYQVKEEFEKYGKVIDYSLRKQLNVPFPYYYGYITLSKKQEADKAREYISKNLSWRVVPFEKDANKDKNNQNKNRQKIQNNQNNNINIKQESPVREILVKNLPNSITESNLYKEFFIFGEISKIELKNGNDNKKYAFIKYRLMASAMKACEEMKNKNFNGSIIKVNFSNINQRKDIKGNEENYELNENNCKLIITTLNDNCLPPNEDIFIKIFENFGKVKGHAIKIYQNKHCIYIEYYKPEDAKRAVEELNNDNNLENRKLLGDENCDINFYFKSKSYDFKFNPFTHYTNNNMNNMNMFQNMNNSYQNTMISNMFMGMGFGMNNPQFTLLMQKNLNNQFNLNTNNLNNFQNQKPNLDYNLNIQNQEKIIDNNIQNNNLSNKQIINNQLNNLNMNYQFNNSFKNPMMPFNFMNTQMYSGMPTMNYPKQTQEAIPNNYQIQNQ